MITLATRLLTVAVLLAAGGCVSPLGRAVPETALREEGTFELVHAVDVPELRRGEGCGAQALAASLAHLDPDLDARTLAEALPWHELGATPVDLLLEARRRGRTAVLARGSWSALEENVRAQLVSLVMLDVAPDVLVGGPAASPVMHWTAVTGVARDGATIALGAPKAHHHLVAREVFTERWSRSAFCQITIR